MSPMVFDYFADMLPMYWDYFVKNHAADVFLMTILDIEIIQENFYYS